MNKFLLVVAVLLISSCSTLHTSNLSSVGHLSRPKFFPRESGKGFYGRKLYQAKDFHCIKIKSSDSWRKLFPNSKERQLVIQLNQMNMSVTLRSWILVPDGLIAAKL
ncbi:hypothetical protein [Coxiella-like endosymbiont of Rhipicephalus sanguineus]|uniref:hypothetical protein n=1 Tax=Coxiella-like endosymbiont of Rhipicephalus sanguineus TaxID=1955402 RepID=UPI00203D5278|nr:hypothetical protein [Coxiella-like endosymbiont of Rhipicephalus sanguineus]